MQKTSLKGNNFLIRLLSGACFVTIIVGFFLLARFVNIKLFAILLWFVCSVGTFEVARAMKKYSNKTIFYTQLIFGFLLIPVYFFFDIFFSVKESILFTLAYILLGILVVVNENIFTSKQNSPIKEVIANIAPLLYPSILVFMMLLPIVMWNSASFVVLLLTFVICPLCDSFAYLVGMTWQKIKKGQAKKLCPNLSPKKTVAGGIGGLVGAVIGSLIIALCYKFTFTYVLLYCAIGLVSGFACQIGDLFESLIKRKVGIKDMGKIMPGHGGIMDRFDGITFTGALLFVIFYILMKI